jgi:hypothetical protein
MDLFDLMNADEKLRLIRDYLEYYQDLWWSIYESGCSLPIMDVVFEQINEPDYMGCDFTGDKQVWQFFFIGDCSHFPAIHKTVQEIDEAPVYEFDFEDLDNLKVVGNFRQYMEKVLNEYIENMNKIGEDIEEAEDALKNLERFSDILIVPEIYTPKLND